MNKQQLEGLITRHNLEQCKATISSRENAPFVDIDNVDFHHAISWFSTDDKTVYVTSESTGTVKATLCDWMPEISDFKDTYKIYGVFQVFDDLYLPCLRETHDGLKATEQVTMKYQNAPSTIGTTFKMI